MPVYCKINPRRHAGTWSRFWCVWYGACNTGMGLRQVYAACGRTGDMWSGTKPGGTKFAHQCFLAGVRQHFEFILTWCLQQCEHDYFDPIAPVSELLLKCGYKEPMPEKCLVGWQLCWWFYFSSFRLGTLLARSQISPGASIGNTTGENTLILHRKIFWAIFIHMAREAWAKGEFSSMVASHP